MAATRRRLAVRASTLPPFRGDRTGGESRDGSRDIRAALATAMSRDPSRPRPPPREVAATRRRLAVRASILPPFREGQGGVASPGDPARDLSGGVRPSPPGRACHRHRRRRHPCHHRPPRGRSASWEEAAWMPARRRPGPARPRAAPAPGPATTPTGSAERSLPHSSTTAPTTPIATRSQRALPATQRPAVSDRDRRHQPPRALNPPDERSDGAPLADLDAGEPTHHHQEQAQPQEVPAGPARCRRAGCGTRHARRPEDGAGQLVDEQLASDVQQQRDEYRVRHQEAPMATVIRGRRRDSTSGEKNSPATTTMPTGRPGW